VEFKLAAVNQSSKAGQQGNFWADHQGPVVADPRRPALGTADPKPASQNVVLNVSNVAMNSPAGAPGIGHQLPLTLANPMTAMWPIAVIRPGNLSGSNAAKAAGHPWAASARQSKKTRVPVSGRSCPAASDPYL
jgi:hypothetical protein